jgi:nucleotide-binding universal stress UspA family protein
MYERILVPLDGSKLAEKMLTKAREMARLHDAEIVLLRVVRGVVFPGIDPTDKEVEVVDEAQAYLNEVAGDLKKEGLKVATSVRYGHPAKEIIDASKKADLVAMSTHGRTGLGRWALGSVAEKVLRHSEKPVLLIRAED